MQTLDLNGYKKYIDLCEYFVLNCGTSLQWNTIQLLGSMKS